MIVRSNSSWRSFLCSRYHSEGVLPSRSHGDMKLIGGLKVHCDADATASERIFSCENKMCVVPVRGDFLGLLKRRISTELYVERAMSVEADRKSSLFDT